MKSIGLGLVSVFGVCDGLLSPGEITSPDPTQGTSTVDSLCSSTTGFSFSSTSFHHDFTSKQGHIFFHLRLSGPHISL